MALRWIEDFRQYQTGVMSRDVWSGNLPTLSDSGRNGKRAANWNKNTMIRGGGGTTVYVVGGYKVESGGRVITSNVSEAGYTSSTLTSAHWLVGCAWNGFAYCGIVATEDGGIHVVSGGAFENGPSSQDVSIIGSSAPGALPLGRGWFVLEFLAVIGITGSVTVRINGKTVLNIAGVYTKNPGDYCEYVLRQPACPAESPLLWPNYADSVVVGGGTRGGRYTSGLQGWTGAVDFLATFDERGTIDGSTFLGDIQVDDRLPSGNGATQESTITGSTPAATRWQSVDDALTPDGDVTSVTFFRDTLGLDEYQLSALTIDSGATIYGVQPSVIGRTSAPGFATAIVGARDGASTVDAVPILMRSPSFKYLASPLPLAPDGGDWTVAKVNAFNLRLKRGV